MKRHVWKGLQRYISSYNSSYDVVLVGGGVMGLSSAYFLAKRINPSSICVIERDTNYVESSTALSWGSIRQQFSIPENILMSQFGFKFLENIDKYLGTDGETVDVLFRQGTYCFLASEAGKTLLEENAKVQRTYNVPVSLLTRDELAIKYPWLNLDGIVMASNVSHGEGWFDPWSLLSSFKKKVLSMGVHFIQGEVMAIEQDKHEQISGVKVSTNQTPTNLEYVKCGNLVNAAGPWAQTVAHMIGIELPVKADKRDTMVVHCPTGFVDSVLLIDGIHDIFLRPESRHIYCIGYPLPKEKDEDKESDLQNIDYEYFNNEIWPKLAHRIPAFESLKVTNAWSGYYEYNTWDQNGIISRHPEIRNLFFANGFSGHGIQQSPAVGRAISELIVDGAFKTIDLSQFSYDRFYNNVFVVEKNII